MHHFSLVTWRLLLFLFVQSACFFGVQNGAAQDVSVSQGSEPDRTFSLTPEEQQYLAGKQQISMCIDPDWMPLEGIENKRHVGMTAEYMELFSRKLGIPIVLVPTKDWTDSLAYAKGTQMRYLLPGHAHPGAGNLHDLHPPVSEYSLGDGRKK